MSFGPYAQAFEGLIELSDVPELDLGERMGSTDYIDFLSPADMKVSSIVRFVDKYGRPGFALHVRRRNDSDTFVLAPFQRYVNTPNFWSFGWGNSDGRLENQLNGDGVKWLASSCTLDLDFLRGILDGSHEIELVRA